MTAYVVLDLLDKFDLDWDSTFVNILTSSTTPFLGGTTSELLAIDTLSVKELMYGMMLPSGNDSAQSLAIYFGNLLQISQMKQGKLIFVKNKNNLGQVDANLDEEKYN